MKRIIIICEGPTERAFCTTTLQPYLQGKGIIVQSPLIKRSRGGIVKWPILKREIEIYLKSDAAAYLTTFIDYYGLYPKHNFPNWNECEKIQDCGERMTAIENAMFCDISENMRYRFIPYIQLHEFEGLIFNNIDIFFEQIPKEDIVDKEELIRIFNDYDNPELINDKPETSPSHRLKRIIKGYNKIVYGDILTAAIGLERIRKKSPRFNNWINKIESIYCAE
jgi:hypothetical protein